MPKRYSSKQIEKFLSAMGFVKTSQKGSHIKFKHNDGKITILPCGKKIIPPGTVNGILEKAQIEKSKLNDFFS